MGCFRHIYSPDGCAWTKTRHHRAPGEDNRPVSRVLIVEDDGFTRMLLASQVEQFGHVVAAAEATATEGISAAREHDPEAALLDLDLGRGPTGIDVALALRDELPRVGLVLLTTYADVRLIGDQRALPSGALTLVKRALTDSEQLAAALRVVIADPLGDRTQSANALARLSDNQVELLRLVASGFSNAEIARRRHQSESAVIKALGRLVDRLQLHPGPGDNQRVLLTQCYFTLTGTAGQRRD